MTASAPRSAPASRARSWRDWALFGVAYAIIVALLLGAPSGVQQRTAEAGVASQQAAAPQAALRSAVVR
ncbi:hypothetical protein [Roseixanthobacter liquoris]|uniref:hypothetical protein n=1 Tax=Roseixanthobacter liquoris TaxID=3119921 RepID=UPI00372A030A